MNYRQAVIKRRLEWIGIIPFVFVGKCYGWLFPLKIPTRIFLFFPSADIGGAIKVNADIADCLKEKNPLIIYSKKPNNNGHASLFQKFRRLDLHRKIDNKWFHFVNFFYRGVLSAWINRAKDPVVLGGESLYFYKILPHIKKTTRVLEVCHLPTWFPYTIGFIDLIDVRIFSTLRLKQDAEEIYRKNQLPEYYFNRLHFIENKIDIPDLVPMENTQLEVVYIGRGAPQKRVHLIAEIAHRLQEKKAPVHFSFVGDVENSIDPGLFPFCTFFGNIRDPHQMNTIYRQSDLLILTSSYEGLPVVIMQMMAYGKLVLSTAVNAIPDYIVHLQNGLLITETEEERIIEQGVELIEFLMANPGLKKRMGERNREIAVKRFSGELFCREYDQLIAASDNKSSA